MKPSLDLDHEKVSGADAKVEGVTSLDDPEYRARLTRSIVFKFDTRLLPILAVLFLCSFLDRTNVGNAKIYGLTEDLNMTNHQYNMGLAVFYATYIAR